jgi:DNA-binding protein H-NS
LKNHSDRSLDATFWCLLEAVKAERDELEKLVRQLTDELRLKSNLEKRFYPLVRAKYRNPKNESETWSGRGKQPRWLVAELADGRDLTDFLIHPTGKWSDPTV